jgi:hypothetical protein
MGEGAGETVGAEEAFPLMLLLLFWASVTAAANNRRRIEGMEVLMASFVLAGLLSR